MYELKLQLFFLLNLILIDMLQQEIIEIQLRYQKELERLEKDNKELRKTLLLKNSHKMNMRKVKVKTIKLVLYLNNNY